MKSFHLHHVFILDSGSYVLSWFQDPVSAYRILEFKCYELSKDYTLGIIVINCRCQISNDETLSYWYTPILFLYKSKRWGLLKLNAFTIIPSDWDNYEIYDKGYRTGQGFMLVVTFPILVHNIIMTIPIPVPTCN